MLSDSRTYSGSRSASGLRIVATTFHPFFVKEFRCHLADSGSGSSMKNCVLHFFFRLDHKRLRNRRAPSLSVDRRQKPDYLTIHRGLRRNSPRSCQPPDKLFTWNQQFSRGRRFETCSVQTNTRGSAGMAFRLYTFRALSRGPRHFEVSGGTIGREPGHLVVPEIWGGANDSVRARSGGQTEGHGEHFGLPSFAGRGLRAEWGCARRRG